MGSVKRAGDATLDVESGEEDERIADGDILGKHLLKSNMLAALQDSLNAETLAALPLVVRKRVNALKNLQLQVVELEAKFYEEIHALEFKYMQQYQPFFEKRSKIVNAEYEPEEEECVNNWTNESDDEELAAGIKGATITEITDGKETAAEKPKLDENTKGIPDFWLTIFRNVSMLSQMTQEYDEPILKYLTDIKAKLLEKEPMGFVLEFHFAQNPYFRNSVLTKEYYMKCKPDEDNPLEFEGPEIYSCKGCEINWHNEKNVTVKTIRKKQKHKSRGSIRTVIKTVQADSFFNFFNPPAMPEELTSPLTDDVQALLTSDFEIGHYIRERVIPRAVVLFTGEGLDDDEDYDEEEEEEEEECSSEEDDGDEALFKMPQRRHVKKAAAPNPAECKQQ